MTAQIPGTKKRKKIKYRGKYNEAFKENFDASILVKEQKAS
jgi:hypothetical protein